MHAAQTLLVLLLCLCKSFQRTLSFCADGTSRAARFVKRVQRYKEKTYAPNVSGKNFHESTLFHILLQMSALKNYLYLNIINLYSSFIKPQDRTYSKGLPPNVKPTERTGYRLSCSRISTRRILPEIVFGRASTNSMIRGYL